MVYRIVRSEDDIKKLLAKCAEAFSWGSKYPGMSYEEGIREAIMWLIELGLPNPLEDEE